jgi:hypothetical protein
VLRNRTFMNWELGGRQRKGQRPGEADVIARYRTGGELVRYDCSAPTDSMEGSVLESCLYSGTGAGKIAEVQRAGSLVQQISRDAVASRAS